MHARAFEGFKVWDGWSPVARVAGNDDRARTGWHRMSGISPPLPSWASAGHGSYFGISCSDRRSCTTVEDDPIPTFRHSVIICAAQSEIRLDGSRDRSVFCGTVSIWVFGTGTFRPVTEDTPIGFGRGPSCCEDALIFDGELELQCLALIVGVGSPSFIDGAAADILSAASLPCFPRGFVIDEPITFHHVQGLSVRRAVLINGGKRPDLKSHGVDYQGVAFVMAHRIPIPGSRHLRRMRRIHAYTSDFMILLVEHRDLVRLLQQ